VLRTVLTFGTRSAPVVADAKTAALGATGPLSLTSSGRGAGPA
jgi:hypothetical protein